jgi:hypothetical protein
MKNFLVLFLIVYPFTLIAQTSISVNVPYKNIVSFNDSSFYCSHIFLKNDYNKIKNLFIVHTGSNNNYFVPEDNFILIKRYNIYYPLMKMSFRFLDIKDNVLPYLHPSFVIKLLFILNKLNNAVRITDAMRSSKEQIVYKKRGWTDVIASPHIIGLAIDLGYYSGTGKNIILKYYKPLEILYLEHGGKHNTHIHLQDNEIWTLIKKAKEPFILEASCELITRISDNNYAFKNNSIEYKRGEINKSLNFKFYSENLSVVKILFENNFGEMQALITSGVFEPGNNNIFINHNFLKKGVYRVKIFLNNFFMEERCVVRY